MKTLAVQIAWERIDAMVARLLAQAGFAFGDIEAAVMQGRIGPLSRVCKHARWDENATARVCLSCKTVLPRPEGP